jgi:two-component system response regulator MprA
MSNRVLIADDDRAIRESLERALGLEGYDVVTAVDGVEALVRARRDSFSALVVLARPRARGSRLRRLRRCTGRSSGI